VFTWVDKDARFDPHSDARFPARHRQLSYIVAFFGIWLVAYGAGYFHVPLGISGFVVMVALAGGMDVQKEKTSSNLPFK
jgi:hypothetical protein